MKKRLIKNFLLVVVMAVLCFAVMMTASAQDRTVIDSGECGAQGDNVIWTLYDDGELVISGEGEMKDYYGDWGGHSTDWYEYDIYTVTIENGVTHIGAGAFYSDWSYENKIVAVHMADSVKSIGQKAFYKSNYLSEIYLSKALCEINEEAFYDCQSLKNIEIPDAVTMIGDYAFRDCDSLTTITIPRNVVDLGLGLFIDCDNLANAVLEEGITYIADSMFWGCRRLETITIPNTVITIADCALGYYSDLEEIKIPASVEFIGESAFACCYNLEKIIVDPDNKNYSSDEEGVLFNKDKTKLIQYPNGKTDSVYVVPETTKTISTGAFSGLLDLEEIVLPSSLETLEYAAIANSPSIIRITIPENVRSVDSLAFCYSMFIEDIYVKGMDTRFIEYSLTIGNVRIGVSREEFIEIAKRYVSEKDEDARQDIETEINDCLIYIDGLDYPTIYCHEGSTMEAYAIEKAQENILEYNIPYVLTHFYEDDWTYDYDNMIRYRKCIHCDELETEQLETTENSDVEIIEPVDPDTDFVVDVITDYVIIEEALANGIAGDWEIVKAFDITMTGKDGVHVQPDGTVKVKLPLDWSKEGVYKVYRLNDDGTLTDMNAYRQGSHMVFDTDHFSIYVIVDESEQVDVPTDTPEEETKGNFFSKLIDLIKMFFALVKSWLER